MKNLIVYESKYGTTKESAYILSKIIGYSKVIKPLEFSNKDENFDNYIFLLPVYNEKISENILNLIKNNIEFLIKKNIYFIIVNLLGRHDFYLKEAKDMLKDPLINMHSINGNLILDKLDENDLNSIKNFFTLTHSQFKDRINFNINEVIQLTLNIKNELEIKKAALKEEIIKDIITKFITNHNTCVISTSCDITPRATPIEYIYYKKTFYFISEGGIKFANILRNNNVSIAIFDNYSSMNKIGGLQITGKASFVEFASEEYYEIMTLKNINSSAINKLDIILNIIKVDIEKIEALNTDFKKYNGDSKQILYKL